MKIFLTLCAVLVAASASAQPRPGAFTTLTTTSQAPTSICVGCPLGSTTPAAGSGITTATVVLPSGAPAITTNKLYSIGGSLFFNGVGLASGSSVSGTTGTYSKFTSPTSLSDSLVSESGSTITMAGLLAVTGLGVHSITASGTGLQVLNIRNTNAGTASGAVLQLGNDLTPNQTVVEALSSTWVPGALNFNIANSSVLVGIGTGGLNLATLASAPIRLFTGNIEVARVFASGGMSLGNTTDPGATNLSVTGSGTLGSGVIQGTFGVGSTTTLGGNLYVGGNVNVTDSVGAPTVGGGWGGAGRAITGRNYAFVVTIGAGVAGTGFATFSTPYTTAPICTVSIQTAGALYNVNVATTTTAVEIDGNYIAGDKLYVLCRGF
jgi:hypothetical protein